MNISKISIEPTSEIIKVIKVLKVTGKKLLLVINKIKNLLEPLLMVILEKLILKKIKKVSQSKNFIIKNQNF